MTAPDRTIAYTDGACSGNPGPGGWAWIVPDGPFASGFADHTTNQRMELQAVLDAVRSLDGPLRIVSDSTYVVNCFRDGWWKGWLARGWKNTKKEPVANRDLWEPLIELHGHRDLAFEWVKGHGGDEWNDYADRLAVEASFTQRDRRGAGTPTEIGEPDLRRGEANASNGERGRDPTGREAPAGRRLAVLGLRPRQLGGYDDHARHDRLRGTLRRIIGAKAEMYPNLVVMSGMRLGTELLAAEATLDVGARLVAVLPYPDPDSLWPAEARSRFRGVIAGAAEVITLQGKAPADQKQARAALARRNGWFARNSHEALVVWDNEDAETAKVLNLLQDALGEDEVWILPAE